MSRYIDADDVANAIYHHFPSVRTMADARSVIEEVPTIDAVSVVHGEWIWNQYDANPQIGNYHCSKCRWLVRHDKYAFCPNCGAKMDGERKESE